MNKSFLVLLFLTGCSSIDYSYFGYAYNFIKDDERLELTSDVEAKIPYSFVFISQGKNNAIFVLSHIINNEYHWTGSNYETIVTKNGIIISTSGLEKDLTTLVSSGNYKVGIQMFNSVINLINPDLYAETIIYSLMNSEIDDNKIEFLYEKVYLGVNLSVNERFEYQKGLITESTQYINPLSDPLEMRFYYKY